MHPDHTRQNSKGYNAQSICPWKYATRLGLPSSRQTTREIKESSMDNSTF